MACAACHTVFPELTHFGRVFKANGYVLDNLEQVQAVSSRRQELLELAKTPALSIMAQVSYTELKTRLPDVKNPAAPGLILVEPGCLAVHNWEALTTMSSPWTRRSACSNV